MYDLKFALNLKNKKFFIPLEKSYLKKNKIKLLNFLKINYSKKINIATYNGKIWIGDKLSQSRTHDGSFNKEVKKIYNDKFYSKKDKYILIYFYGIYKKFGYNNDINFNFYYKLKYFFYSFMPMNFEIDTIIAKPLKLSNYYFYFKRVFLFIKNI